MSCLQSVLLLITTFCLVLHPAALCFGVIFNHDMCSFGSARSALAPPCLSTRTRSEGPSSDFPGACAKGGDKCIRLFSSSRQAHINYQYQIVGGCWLNSVGTVRAPCVLLHIQCPPDPQCLNLSCPGLSPDCLCITTAPTGIGCRPLSLTLLQEVGVASLFGTNWVVKRSCTSMHPRSGWSLQL